ncbi:unnamed protein product [Dibothriocephalus latus]|uniref:Uncharacterized protein n=1 Tax=Dibothriocephalus latus TaxID=60516 RepID=A0A3P7LQ22_DIBLA|nr:unnamed protein product [Dibothriocephalus latus]
MFEPPMHYKTFATRNTRNLRFEQLRQSTAPQRSQPSPPTISVTPPSSTNLLSAPLSPRKRVNVVSFVPQGASEVITKSPEKPDHPKLADSCTSDSIDPYSSQTSSPPIISSAVPVCVPSKTKAPCPPQEATMPKPFSTTTALRGKRNGLPLTSRTANANWKSSSSVHSAPASISDQASSRPPQPVCEKDPYEWADGEEEETGEKTPKLTAGDEDSDDDGVKPWFWPATRSTAAVPGKNSNEPAKPVAQKPAVLTSTTTTTSKTSTTSIVSKDGKILVSRNEKSDASDDDEVFALSTVIKLDIPRASSRQTPSFRGSLYLSKR